MDLFPSYGGAAFRKNSKKVIRLILKGCTNRPFFHISVQEHKKKPEDPVIEQIGNYDPLPNHNNEKLVGINFQRLEYWLKKGAVPTVPVQKILGLCGYFQVHPDSFKDAYLRRKRINDELNNLKAIASTLNSSGKTKSSESVSASPEFEVLSNKDATSSEKDTSPNANI